MSPTIRTLLASFVIASVAPAGLAILGLEQPAFAKNGNGGGNGGGHGGGHGNSGNHGNSGSAHGNAKTADTTEVEDGISEETTEDSLAPSALGKLNGVLHASPNALAHANINSPIGTAHAFGEALAGFLDAAAEPTDEEAPAEETTDEVTIEELGEMMANMTNKPVTAEQVEAVAAKLGIETTEPETTDEAAAAEETTGEEPTGEEPTDVEPTLDPATAQAIADEANAIHGFPTDDDTVDDAADSGETPEETVTN